MEPPDYSGLRTTKGPDKNHMKLRNTYSVVTGIEPTTSGLLDQRRSHSDNQAPLARPLLCISLWVLHYGKLKR